MPRDVSVIVKRSNAEDGGDAYHRSAKVVVWSAVAGRDSDSPSAEMIDRTGEGGDILYNAAGVRMKEIPVTWRRVYQALKKSGKLKRD